jgi:Fe-Mn family superoxide dismutase
MKIQNSIRGSFSRRDMLKTLGAGAALLSAGLLAKQRLSADDNAKVKDYPPLIGGTDFVIEGFKPLSWELPKLNYAYDGLEPHIDARTMEIHYTKHHQAYIDNATKVLADHPELLALGANGLVVNLDKLPEKIRTAVRNNAGGHVNHTFFWSILAAVGGGGPAGALADAITKTFGSFDDFKKQFAIAALGRFGSGWAWLSVKDGALTIHSTANQDSPLTDGFAPVLALDVWEHAYYLKHQNKRAAYIEDFWSVANWPQAGTNYEAALKA